MKEFVDYFWGDKNQGFDVLYHNMKHGQVSSKELTDFIRDRHRIEEAYSLSLAKLAKTAANSSCVGTFAPVWQILKNCSDKLSSLHMDMVHKYQDLQKELQKYNDEQHKKYKTIKEQESGTLEVVQLVQQTMQNLQKSKEAYVARGTEYEKLRQSNGSPKDLEKAEAKFRKAKDEYKSYVEKYANIRSDFEKKMLMSCRHFQEVEIEHIKKMKTFVEIYAKTAEGHQALIQQVHTELKQQSDELTVEKLIDHFIQHKGTGTEKLGPIEFEELDTTTALPPLSSPEQQLEKNNSNTDLKIKKEGFLSRTKNSKEKKKEKKKKKRGEKETTPENEEKKPDGDTSSVLTEPEHNEFGGPEVDEEGFVIRPEAHNNYDGGWKYNSGSETSDSDEEEQKKIQVKIRPLGNTQNVSASVDELRATIEGLSLSPVERKKNYISESNMKRSQSLSDPFGKPSSDLLDLDFRSPPTSSPSSTPTGGYSGVRSPTSFNTASSDQTTPVSNPAACSFPDATDDAELNNLPPPPSKSTSGSSIAIPRPPSRTRERPRANTPAMTSRGHASPIPAMVRTESVSSMGSINSDSFKTTSMPVSSSRGPSPLTIGMSDTVPLAVAFTETVNAYFKGASQSKCKVRVTGDMLVSFPSGIVQILTNNPSPSSLKFKLKGIDRLQTIIPNKHLLSLDTNLSTDEYRIYTFDMSALREHLRGQAESNPTASFFNIDILKYQMKVQPGTSSCPLHLLSHWKCEDTSTNLRIDYKYNSKGSVSSTLLNILAVVTVDGGVTNMQAVPQATWSADTQRVMWKISELNQHSENSGNGVLRAKFDINNGPSTPSTVAVQFYGEGRTLSGADFELVGTGYRVSLVKRRFTTGKYYCDAEAEAKFS